MSGAWHRAWPFRLAACRDRAETEASVVLVRRGDHAQRFACARLGDLRVGERRAEQALDPADACGGERERVRPAPLADSAPGPRRVPDKGTLRPALGAARQVRQVAGEPEQLQLKGENE